MTRQWPLSLKLGKDDIVNYFVGFGHGQDPEPGQGERAHHSSEHRHRPVHFRLEKVRIVDHSVPECGFEDLK